MKTNFITPYTYIPFSINANQEICCKKKCCKKYKKSKRCKKCPEKA